MPTSGRAIVDANTNGLSDVWENLHSPGVLDAATDPDSDGQNNLQESIAGTDPCNAVSVFRLQSALQPAALLLRWPSVTGKRYQIQTAGSLGVSVWQAQGLIVEGTGGEVIGAVPRSNQPFTACRLRVVQEHPVLFSARSEFLHDTDGDGFSDLSEFGAGTDLFATNSHLRITRWEFGKAVRLTWPGVVGKSYVVEGTTNPGVGSWQEETGVLSGVDDAMSVTVAPQSRHRFFRVRVSDADSDGDGVTDWEERLTGTDAGLIHYRTNFPTRAADISAMLGASNLISLEVDRPTANLTRHASANLRVIRTGNLAPLTIHYATFGDAVPGLDYQPLSGTVELPAGAREASIPVVPLDGAVLSPAKTVGVILMPGSGYGIGTNSVAEIRVVMEVALSVKDFGATGDGITDDTAAIQSAIDALEASTTHNTLHFPPGTYRLNSPSYDADPTFSWYQLLKLGNTELAGRDLFFTGATGATLYSTVNSVRANMLMVRARFRSLTFSGLNWAKEETALPEISGEPNNAAGVLVINFDLRRVAAVDFLNCSFTNCHGAAFLFGLGFDLRGKLGHFGFRRCQVTNPYGSNTTNAWLAYGGGQQVRLNPWVASAVYADNYFDGGSDDPDPVRNPGGVRKDGSHFGSPLRLLFTNNVVRRMGIEAVHQVDEPYMGATASPFTIPPPDGMTTAQVTVLPIPSTYAAGQLLNFRTWFHATAEATNVFLTVVAYNPATRVITFTNNGMSPNVQGQLVPSLMPIYLQDYNPTFATISGNLIDGGAPRGDIGITANAKATIVGNRIVGYVAGIQAYENPRNPIFPPTAGSVIESNFILTHDSPTAPGLAYGIISYGPGEIVANNLIVTPITYRFVGVVSRDNHSWIEANTIIP